MAASVRYRPLTTMAEFEQAADLELTIWGGDMRDAVPAHVMRAIEHAGGLILGARIDAAPDVPLVGISISLPARRDPGWALWSHLTGVHPDHQGRGIGFGLKQAQRAWALDHGFDTIRWTFDPLLRGNANFNLNRLGAQGDRYHVNLYGEMRDTINVNAPSDRMEVVWAVHGPGARSDDIGHVALMVLLSIDADDQPHRHNLPTSSLPYVVHIPRDLRKLPAASVLTWRLALREVMQTAFAQGYVATHFVEMPDRSFYVLRQLQ
ncbi:MAG: hypothetical protein GYB67_13475 [Chloroflexi bacterium]|nr:hypothetical protein [Chloroflexota bacterium]